jgi:hypothetical protein
MLDGKKIVELRLLLVKARVGGPDAWEDLMAAVGPCLGELLAAADATCKIRALFPGVPWPQWLESDQLAVVGCHVRDSIRELERLEETARLARSGSRDPGVRGG